MKIGPEHCINHLSKQARVKIYDQPWTYGTLAIVPNFTNSPHVALLNNTYGWHTSREDHTTYKRGLSAKYQTDIELV